MQILWDEKDIFAGRRVTASLEPYIIGFFYGRKKKPYVVYTIVSLADGMQIFKGTKKQIAERLTSSKFLMDNSHYA